MFLVNKYSEMVSMRLAIDALEFYFELVHFQNENGTNITPTYISTNLQGG